jgi:hypothetical protein
LVGNPIGFLLFRPVRGVGMDNLENRVQELEREVKTLKLEISKTLFDIRESLPEKPRSTLQWQKKAWILALLNTLLAATLFANIYFYLPGNLPAEISPALAGWLRALWIALAFIWLFLQLYPLILLLEQEDAAWQGVVQRNAISFVRAHPGFWVAVTFIVLVVALINMVMPAAWLIVALVILVGAGAWTILAIIELIRHRQQGSPSE